MSRTPTKEGFQVARIAASPRESTYVTEQLPDGKERQINKSTLPSGKVNKFSYDAGE